MKSIIALMISSIIISIPGNTAGSQLNKELLEGGSKVVLFDQTKIDAAPTESIIEDSGRKLKRSAPGGDIYTVGWWLRNSMPGNDVNTPIVTGPPQGVLNRLKRSAPGGDIYTVGWWLRNSMPGNDVNTPIVTGPSQGVLNRLKRSAPGGDIYTVGWWLRNSMPGNDVNTPIVTGPSQGVLNRNKRNAPIGGSSSPMQFTTSTVSTSTDAYDRLRWKWIATGGLRKCLYDRSDVRCPPLVSYSLPYH